MNLDKCKAVTKEGTPCKKNAMENSQYCWIHSFGRVKKVQWYRNATIQVAISLIVTLAFSYYLYSKTATKDSQLRIERTLDQKLEELRDYDEKNYGELIRKYPLGWIYFVINEKQKQIISKDRTHLSTDYEVDWNSARILELSSQRIIFETPTILHKPTGNFFSGNRSIAGRVVGRPYKVGISMRGVRMWFELLVDDREKLIWLIGFREEKPTDE